MLSCHYPSKNYSLWIFILIKNFRDRFATKLIWLQMNFYISNSNYQFPCGAIFICECHFNIFSVGKGEYKVRDLWGLWRFEGQVNCHWRHRPRHWKNSQRRKYISGEHRSRETGNSDSNDGWWSIQHGVGASYRQSRWRLNFNVCNVNSSYYLVFFFKKPESKIVQGFFLNRILTYGYITYTK